MVIIVLVNFTNRLAFVIKHVRLNVRRSARERRITRGLYVNFLPTGNHPTGVFFARPGQQDSEREASRTAAEEPAMGHLWLAHQRPHAQQLKGVDPWRGLAFSESQCSKIRNASSVGARVMVKEGSIIVIFGECGWLWPVGADQRSGEGSRLFLA